MKTQFSVGLLVIVAFGLLIGFTLFLTGERLRNRGELFETYIRESVQGLEVGAPVRFRGVAIGRVTEIGLVSSRYRRPEGVSFAGAFQLVLVRFTVQMQLVGEVPSVMEAVDIGLRARLSSQGLTGVGYIELDFADPDRFPMQPVPWTPEAQYVPSIPSNIAQVQDSATMLLQRLENVDIQAIATNLTNLLADARNQLAQGGDIQVMLADASQVMRSVRSAVDTADLPAVAVELRRTVGAAQALLTSRDLQQAISQGSAAMTELRNAAARLPASINQLEAGFAQRARRDAGRAGGPGADPTRPARDDRQSARRDGGVAAFTQPDLARRPAAGGSEPMKRRAWLAGLALGGCSVLPDRPYIETLRFPLVPTRPGGGRGAGREVLLIRDMRAAPGLDMRGLRSVRADGTLATAPYAEWAALPAEAAEGGGARMAACQRLVRRGGRAGLAPYPQPGAGERAGGVGAGQPDHGAGRDQRTPAGRFDAGQQPGAGAVGGARHRSGRRPGGRRRRRGHGGRAGLGVGGLGKRTGCPAAAAALRGLCRVGDPGSR